MISMFQSTNVELTNAKHCTNIIDLHQQKKYNEIEHIIETLGNRFWWHKHKWAQTND
jgi:hypothetical protein